MIVNLKAYMFNKQNSKDHMLKNVFTLYISDVCLFRNPSTLILKEYDCRNFTDGCPNTTYFSSELYKCKLILFFPR